MAVTITRSEWKGHEKLNFTVGGRESFIVCPKTPDPDMRWAWRAEFFGAFDSVDLALLEAGWHLAYHQVSDMYGCPESISMLHEFYSTAVAEFGLCAKTVIFGFSRGGLYSVNYAAVYPETVAALYLDAPVLDIRSWPGGLWSGIGAEKEWRDCMRLYGIDETSAPAFNGNPLDKAADLARADIPVIIVLGEADEVVPPSENSYPFEKSFREAGGRLAMISKPGCGHHPHSLDDPTPVVNFILRNFAPTTGE